MKVHSIEAARRRGDNVPALSSSSSFTSLIVVVCHRYLPNAITMSFIDWIVEKAVDSMQLMHFRTPETSTSRCPSPVTSPPQRYVHICCCNIIGCRRRAWNELPNGGFNSPAYFIHCESLQAFRLQQYFYIPWHWKPFLQVAFSKIIRYVMLCHYHCMRMQRRI
jgi:hypothetical protein